MTRALGVALVITAALAVVTGTLLFLHTRVPPNRRGRPAPVTAIPGPARLTVLAVEAPDRAVVVAPRAFAAGAADFPDGALARALGIPEGRWRFLEVWVLNRGDADLVSLATPPSIERADGSPIVLETLRQIVSGSGTPSARAEMLLRNLAPDPGRPLRNGGLRRTVYAMPAGIAFPDLLSAEVDGLKLARRETTAHALESFFERPRRDLIAALSAGEERPGADSRNVTPEDSR